MSVDKKAVQKELDLAADEMERLGYMDLAGHVDKYNNRMVEAKSGEVATIYRALQNICVEAERRVKNTNFEKPLIDSDAVRARIAMIRRKAFAKKLAEKKTAQETPPPEKQETEEKKEELPPDAAAIKARLDRIRRLKTSK
jgi:hypothetical protein